MSSIDPKPINVYASLPFQTPSISDPDFPETYVKSQLNANVNATTAYASRVKGKHILLENPVRESRVKKEREEKKRKRLELRQKKERNAIARRETRTLKLEASQTKFDLFLPLHHLWLGYMSELLGLGTREAKKMPSSAIMHPKLVKADFHGSIISVRQSKNASLVGISGLVVYETENTFQIITRTNELKLIPKAGSIFAFSVPAYTFTSPPMVVPTSSSQPDPMTQVTVESIPHLEFELYGSQFMFRSSERTTKKFKAKETIAL